MRLLPLIALAALIPSTSAGAQAAPASWDAFLGCWVASDASDYRSTTCYVTVPGAPESVERLTLRDESIVFRGRLTFRVAEPIVAEGCDGAESADASGDGARVYLRGSISCGERQQETSGLMALSPHGEMIRVYAVSVEDQRAVVTERLLPVPEAAIPAVMRERVAASAIRARGARLAATRLLDVAQIEDAVSHADGIVVEAWMVEATRDTTTFRAPRQVLERLVAADAPEGVIDMAVMIANPERFDLYAREEVAFVGPMPGFSPWSMTGWYGAGMLPIPELSLWGAFGYLNPWALSSLYPFGGFNPYIGIIGQGYWIPGLPGGYGYWRRQLANRTYYVPATGGSVPRTPALGRIEKGRGYAPSPTRTGSGSTAVPREPARTTVRPPANASAGKSSGGASSSGSAARPRTESSSGTGRTAQPRDPNKKP